MIPVPGPVLDAFASISGTDAASCEHFGGGHEASDGIVYAYPYKDTQRLLKLLVIPADDQRKGLFRLEERLKFVRFLGDNGAPIVFPEYSPQGNLYETLLFDNKLWIAYIMALVPGQTRPVKSWDPVFFANWGQAIGMLHRLTQQYPAWRASLEPLSGEELLTWQEEWTGFHHWCQDPEVKAQWVGIKQQLDRLPVTRDAFGFIHNDPHIWNVLASGSSVTLLDFDVANHHWFINDIAIACQHVLGYLSGGMGDAVYQRGKLLQFLESFMKGYVRENQLAIEWLDQLDLFIAYRRILLFIVMNDWIRSQPKLHKSWKQMILSQPDVVGAFSGS